MRRSPHRAIFDRPAKRGAPRPGAQSRFDPPCIPSLALLGSLANTQLDGAQAITKDGDDLYFTGVYGFVSLDVSDPTTPSILDSIPQVGMQTPTQPTVVGSYIYAYYSSQTAIIDPADSQIVPIAVASFTGVSGVVDGSYLYLSQNSGMSVIDISNPLAPTVVGTLVDNTNFSNARGIVKSGNYCFVTSSGASRFNAVDVSNPAAPTRVATLSGGSNYNNAHGLSISGNYCFISMNSGLTVVDVTTPTAPVFSAHVNSTLFSRQWHVHDGNYIYSEGNFIAPSGGLTVFNVTTPTAPTQAASVTAATLGDTNGYTGVAKVGNYVYLSSILNDRIRVVDVTTPTAPTSAGSLTSTTNLLDVVGLVASGSDLYAAAEQTFSKIDISTPSTPGFAWTKRGDIVGGYVKMTAVGSHVFGLRTQQAGTATGAIASIDISDPSDLTPDALFVHADLFGGQDIQTDGTYLYVASPQQDKVTIIDASTPTALTHVASITNATTLDGVQALAVQGNYVYCAVVNTDRLTIIDITTKSSPSIVGNVNHSTQLDLAIAVAVNGNYAYVGCLAQNRITVVDVSNPASPTIVGTVQDATYLNRPLGLAVQGDRLFVACQTENRVTTVDVSDPTAPTVITAASLKDDTNLNRLTTSIVVDDDIIYVPVNIGDRVTTLSYACEPPPAPGA